MKQPREALDDLHNWIRDAEIPMSDRLGRIVDGLEALASATPAQAAALPLTDAQILEAWNTVQPDGTNLGGMTSLTGFTAAVRWAESALTTQAPEAAPQPIPEAGA
jgi:hypothetical protein